MTTQHINTILDKIEAKAQTERFITRLFLKYPFWAIGAIMLIPAVIVALPGAIVIGIGYLIDTFLIKPLFKTIYKSINARIKTINKRYHNK